jgi:L-iditol 2-dehydrogenase
MRNAAIVGPRQCEVRSVPEPKAKGPWRLIQVKVAPICTEFHQYEEGAEWWHDLGHEAVGRVLEAPEGSLVKPGDRVAVMPQNGCGVCTPCLTGDHCRCLGQLDVQSITGGPSGRATYAERLIQQEWLLLPIPEDISMVHASAAGCTLGPTFSACQVMKVSALDTLLISGLGPVGLGGVINGVARSARVIGIESNPYRVDLAYRLGAEAVLDPRDPDLAKKVRDLTGGTGATASIEASSAESAPATLLSCTAIGGQLTSVGWGGPLRASDIVRRGVTVRGVWHWNHKTDAEAMWWTIRRTRPLLDMVYTHFFSLDQVKDAWELQMTGQCGKVALLPNGDPESA